MSSEFGHALKITVFGESHGKAIGVTMDGLPAGEQVDLNALQAFLDRRKPGKDALSTKRKEADEPQFLSGITESKTNGFPLCAVIENTDAHSSDYSELAYKPRPSHADYAAYVKWQGNADMRGGGHFSGRLTAPLCIAGGIAKQLLAKKQVFVGAHLKSVADVCDVSFPLFPKRELFESIAAKDFPVIDDEKGQNMRERILAAAKEADSVGGVIECAAIGLPAGIGAPMFDGVENRIAAALFGIPAVKGVEFGAGFESARLKGSHNNDPFIIDENGTVQTKTNNAGGVLGGITSGMPLIVKAAIKPTASIGAIQQTVDIKNKENTTLAIKGRHDPCIAHRAAPVIEAVTAIVLLDMILEENLWTSMK